MQKQEALARIARGVAKFQTEIFPAQRELFERLRRGQDPLALFVTCADSRVNPNLVTQTEPGEIFIERNPGNMVPPYVEFVGGVTAGVEYAMLALKVPLIVVCGHTDCGVMKALLDPGAVHGMPGVQRWMSHGFAARERMLRELRICPQGRAIAAPHGIQRTRTNREPQDASQCEQTHAIRRDRDSRLGVRHRRRVDSRGESQERQV